MRCGEAADEEGWMGQLSSWERLPHSPWKRGGGSAGGALGWGSPWEGDQGLSWARGRAFLGGKRKLSS